MGYHKTGHKAQYLSVSLAKGNGKTRFYYVHRLVATAFIHNPLNKREVNHIDGNPHNNDSSNLEWVTRRENALHMHRNCSPDTYTRPILQFSKNGKLLRKWKSSTEAANHLNLNNCAINHVLRGITKTSGGFKWAYIDGNLKKYLKAKII